MSRALFHLHPDPHHEFAWNCLLVLFVFLLVGLLVVMATLYEGQLPTTPSYWGGDFFKPVPMPFGPY